MNESVNPVSSFYLLLILLKIILYLWNTCKYRKVFHTPLGQISPSAVTQLEYKYQNQETDFDTIWLRKLRATQTHQWSCEYPFHNIRSHLGSQLVFSLSCSFGFFQLALITLTPLKSTKDYLDVSNVSCLNSDNTFWDR